MARETDGRSKLAALLLPLILPDDLYARGLLAASASADLSLGPAGAEGPAGAGGPIGADSLRKGRLALGPRGALSFSGPRRVAVAGLGARTLLVSSIGYFASRGPEQGTLALHDRGGMKAPREVSAEISAGISAGIFTEVGAFDSAPTLPVQNFPANQTPQPNGAPLAPGESESDGRRDRRAG